LSGLDKGGYYTIYAKCVNLVKKFKGYSVEYKLLSVEDIDKFKSKIIFFSVE